MILPFRDVENVAPEKGFRFGYSGLVVVIRGHEELFFEFRQAVGRDDCALTILQILDSIKTIQDSRVLNREGRADLNTAQVEHELLEKARLARGRPLHQSTEIDRSEGKYVVQTYLAAS